MSGAASPAATATSALRSRAVGCRIRLERSTFGLCLQTTLPEFAIEISKHPIALRRSKPRVELLDRGTCAHGARPLAFTHA
jgi:hypothetical protein